MTFFIFLNFPDWKCNSLTFPWPGKFFIFQNFFPDRGNPVITLFMLFSDFTAEHVHVYNVAFHLKVHCYDPQRKKNLSMDFVAPDIVLDTIQK